MTPRRPPVDGSGRSAGRRIVSAIADLVLAVIFVALWLVVLTRGEALSP